MSIKPVDKNMQKGLAIIVGNKTDGILLHTANVLGNKTEYLDDIKNMPNDGIIYLIGHGSGCKHKMTIDGKKMSYIASKLVGAGYTGQQELYSVGCHFCDDKNGKKMSECLEDELKIKLNILNINMKKKAYGKTIVIKNKDKRELYCFSDKHSFWKVLIQWWFILHNGLYCMKNLRMSNKDYQKVDLFKKWLIERFGGRKMNGMLSGYEHIFAFGFGPMLGAILAMGIGSLYNHNIEVSVIQDNRTVIVSIIIGIVLTVISLWKFEEYETLCINGLIIGTAFITIGVLVGILKRINMLNYLDMISLGIWGMLVCILLLIGICPGIWKRRRRGKYQKS